MYLETVPSLHYERDQIETKRKKNSLPNPGRRVVTKKRTACVRVVRKKNISG